MLRLPHIVLVLGCGALAAGLVLLTGRHSPHREPPAAVATAASPVPTFHASTTAATAGRFRAQVHDGQVLGKIVIPRLHLDDELFDGTSERDLARGPGVYAPDFLPGEDGLVYIAGHRTTHTKPFADINLLRPGDRISIAMPYGTFRYVVTGHRIVVSTAVQVLQSHGREQLILQSCHPKYSATHRYLVYARPAAPFRRALSRGKEAPVR